MNEDYPFYPDLSEEGKKEAQIVMEKFIDQLKKSAEDAIHKMHCDIIWCIESDSWENYRNAIMDGFKNYKNHLVQNEYDFKEIRQQIFKDNREDIINDLNQDLLKENEELKKDNERLNQWLRERS